MKRRSILYRLFFSYSLLLLFMGLFSFIISAYLISGIKKQIDQKIYYRGSQVLETLEDHFSSLRSITTLFGTNSAFLPASMLTGPGAKQKGIQILRDTAAYNNDIYLISVYFGGEEFYTSRGFVRPRIYFADAINCTAEAVALGLSVIGMEENAVVYLDAFTGGYLFFHYPAFSSTLAGKQYFNYIISRKDLLGIFQPLLELNNVAIVVSFLNKSSPLELRLEGNLKSGLRIIPPGEEDRRETYKQMFTAVSGISGIGLQVFYVEDDIYMETNRLGMISGISLLLTMLALVSIAFGLSLMYYRKIDGVKNSLEKVWNSGDMAENPANEFEYINSMINRLARRTDQLQFDSEEMRQDMKQQTMKLLIHGIIKDENTAQGILETYHMDLPGPCYALVCVLYNQRKKGIKEALENGFENKLYCEAEAGEPPAFIVMFGLSDKDLKKAARHKIAEELKENFQKIPPGDLKIGFSRVYENIAMISHAYVEALGAAENLAIGGRGFQIGYFDTMISHGNYTVQFSEEDMLEFKNSLQKRDFDAVCGAFEKLRRDMMMPQISEGNQKYLRYLVLQTAIMGVKNMKENDELIHAIIGIDPDDGARFDNRMTLLFRRICPDLLTRQCLFRH